jgi:excinuclease ABC subunit A
MALNVDVESLNPQEYILIKGARVHNLKNVDLAIPRDKLIVITGVSGSGKTSLAFETLFAEGQRRYVESLSSYARQFLGRFDKPDVDWIQGISPAIAIQQKVISRNPRSTVGTSTEIYDYLKLLFARIGQTISPVSGQAVKRNNVADVVAHFKELESSDEFWIASPWPSVQGRTWAETLSLKMQQGFSRAVVMGQLIKLNELDLDQAPNPLPELFIGRMRAGGEDALQQVAEYTENAFLEGKGTAYTYVLKNEKAEQKNEWNDKLELDGLLFESPSLNLFSFNNPFGACKRCEGFGRVLGIDEDLVIPNPSLSVYEGAVACWKGEKLSEWNTYFMKAALAEGFPVHTPYKSLSPEHKNLLWKGSALVSGIDDFFKMVQENLYKIQYRVLQSRYRGYTECGDCRGTRLRKDAAYVQVHGKNIMDLVLLTVSELKLFFENLILDEYQTKVAGRILLELKRRIGYLEDVGLGYLTLNRVSNTLSGGESQRINLATSLGSSLVGSMYILDEPSIGLHPRDTQRLIAVIQQLRNEGNTCIVVEHDADFMKAADHLIDMGPEAGYLGGEVVFSGTFPQLKKKSNSLTAQYLRNEESIGVFFKSRPWKRFIGLAGCRANNLKQVDVKIPLEVLTIVTGVSGSGKTSLIKKILYPALARQLGQSAEKPGQHDSIFGDIASLQSVELIDQNPIGKSSRSNPVTYLKAYDEIRSLFADLPMSKTMGFKSAAFSFNVPGGRCETCEGEGRVTVEMQFMADISLRCDDCQGQRFKDDLLQSKFKDKNIHDVLEMTVDEAMLFFAGTPQGDRIVKKLSPLQRVGLGYVKLGQSSSTLSGGEAQRVKLASFLSKGSTTGKTMFIFDEPTTGLHFHDVKKLMASFQALIEIGHSIVVVEHHTEVMKMADWIIDLGPGGGPEGGCVLFQGKPSDLKNCTDSVTAHFI